MATSEKQHADPPVLDANCYYCEELFNFALDGRIVTDKNGTFFTHRKCGCIAVLLQRATKDE